MPPDGGQPEDRNQRGNDDIHRSHNAQFRAIQRAANKINVRTLEDPEGYVINLTKIPFYATEYKLLNKNILRNIAIQKKVFTSQILQ